MRALRREMIVPRDSVSSSCFATMGLCYKAASSRRVTSIDTLDNGIGALFEKLVKAFQRLRGLRDRRTQVLHEQAVVVR